VRGHELQHKGETHEDSAAPPACLGEKCSSLANSNELIGRALSTEVRGNSSTLPALEKNGSHEHYGVEYEKRKKQIENHFIYWESEQS
jgi:hypothetical protein